MVKIDVCTNGAPDQNRTDTRSLEGYCSTIELQAHQDNHYPFSVLFFQGLTAIIFLKNKIDDKGNNFLLFSVRFFLPQNRFLL